MDRKIDRWMDREMDRETEKKEERATETERHVGSVWEKGREGRGEVKK